MAIRKRDGNYVIDYYWRGKRCRETVGPSKKEAEAALGKIKAQIREGKFFDKKTIPETAIEELIEKYLDSVKGKRSFPTYTALLQPIRDYFKGRFIADIAEYDAETFRTARKDTPTRNGSPRTNGTCNRELAMLKRILNKAVSWELLEKNPIANVKPLPEKKGRTRFLTVEEAGRLLHTAPSHLRPILVCALETGMRRGEILNLCWSDVDLKTGLLYIGETKNGDSRHVPISSRLRETLLKIPRRLGTDYVFIGKPGIGASGIPFHDVRTSFETACRKAGIEEFRFHDLRHTAASHMVMAGVPMKTVGEILGHKTASMTERYSHLTPEHKLKAVEMLPDWETGIQTGHKTVTK